jgi:hypothetical protein
VELLVDRRALLAASYLDHIAIALAVNDQGAPFRTFIDNWYAFEIGAGHLTKGDRPIWFNNPCAKTHKVALRGMHFQSASAAAVLELAETDPARYLQARAKDDAVRLMVDHAIPLRVIVQMLLAAAKQEAPTRESIRARLLRWYHLGVITAEEDTRLNRHGLRSAMPKLWDGKDVFARYAEVGIVAMQR